MFSQEIIKMCEKIMFLFKERHQDNRALENLKFLRAFKSRMTPEHVENRKLN